MWLLFHIWLLDQISAMTSLVLVQVQANSFEVPAETFEGKVCGGSGRYLSGRWLLAWATLSFDLKHLTNIVKK